MNRLKLSLLLMAFSFVFLAAGSCGGEQPVDYSGDAVDNTDATPERTNHVSRSNQESDAHTVSFPQHSEPLLTDRGWQYLLGVLELTNGCLRIRPFPSMNISIDDPDSYLLLWPSNFSLVDAGDDIRVVDGNGLITARVGDTLRVSGKRWYEDDVSKELLTSIPELCRGYGYYWQVGDEVSSIGRVDSLGRGMPETVSIPGSALYFPRSRTRVDGGGGTGVALRAAEAEGELVVDDNCLRIGEEDGYIIIWPPGFVPHIEDDVVEIRNSGGKTIARSGDYLVVGGGESGMARRDDESVPCTGTYWGDISFSSIKRNGRTVWSWRENFKR